MKRTITIVTILTFLGCNNHEQEQKAQSEFKNSTIQSEESIDRASTTLEKGNLVLDGKWKLIQVETPWEGEAIILNNETWNFETEGLLIISEDDSLTKSVEYTLKRTLSGFSSDSVWTIVADFHDYRILSNLEIWKKDKKLELIDQCDDCYTFKFEELK